MKNTTYNNFSKYNFVSLLLPLLCKNGIDKIDEEELSKELYYYYINPQYRELFQDICKSRCDLLSKVDIKSSIFRELIFSGKVWWDSMGYTPLHLCYDKNIDLFFIEKYLSDIGKKRIYQLAKELGIRYAVKNRSPSKMHIYGTDPNRTYELISSKSYGREINLELLTDGDISKITKVSLDESTYFRSAYNLDECMTYKNPQTIYVDIKNATYAIEQGKANNEINYLTLYTNIIDKARLVRIRQIGNCIYTGNNHLITQKKPYVRKIVLK